MRLAADEGDRSRQSLCRWEILGRPGHPVTSSCGVEVLATATPQDPAAYDHIVVVGGLLHGGQKVPAGTEAFLREAAGCGVKLIGLCTGSFVLARAGLLDGHVACVSWFHREEFEAEFPDSRAVSNQMFVVDRDRMTCAGGTSVVHLAAFLIERHIGRASAMKALRIMIEEQPLPSRTLQPEAVMSVRSNDELVHKAMLLLEQQLHAPALIDTLCEPLGVGRRQLERRFQRDVGMSPAAYRQTLRLERARWLLTHTDLEITTIALECGFQSSASFARTVRKTFGSTPMGVRSAAQGLAPCQSRPEVGLAHRPLPCGPFSSRCAERRNSR